MEIDRSGGGGGGGGGGAQPLQIPLFSHNRPAVRRVRSTQTGGLVSLVIIPRSLSLPPVGRYEVTAHGKNGERMHC